ncbi:MAG: hypothetical protein PF448_06645 [Bacteroidales bacterium]|nr:hypothetical protein [Bacteroidales bacterium]
MKKEGLRPIKTGCYAVVSKRQIPCQLAPEKAQALIPIASPVGRFRDIYPAKQSGDGLKKEACLP